MIAEGDKRNRHRSSTIALTLAARYSTTGAIAAHPTHASVPHGAGRRVACDNAHANTMATYSDRQDARRVIQSISSKMDITLPQRRQFAAD